MRAVHRQATLAVTTDARVGACYAASRRRTRPPEGAPMSEDDKLDELVARIAGHRAAAERARRLADEVNDVLAHHSLLQHAQQLEHEAEDLEVQIAVLKDTA
jgi:hypothetical protein